HESKCPPRHEGQALRQQNFPVRLLTKKTSALSKTKNFIKNYKPPREPSHGGFLIHFVYYHTHSTNSKKNIFFS
ncbi:hypothetical protein, partial [Faecalispora jeddahensis]|uniref:hypothetical protein n=1 Tax=Faecalispora jeddahensis TaxID=1414721 RepID=UPI0028B1C3F8